MLKIDSKQLKAVFNYLQPSLSTSSKNPFSHSILIEGNKKDNRITFRASNSDLESTVNLVQGDYEIEKDFVLCVDKFIQNIISKLTGELKFLIDKENLIIKNNKNEYKFGTLESEKFPHKVETGSEKVILVDNKEDFFLPFMLSNFCVADENLVPAYTSFNLDHEKVATTKETTGVVLNIDMGKSNPPAKEMNFILSALKFLGSDDELFYHFGNEYCIIRVSAKEFDVEYIFTPIDSSFPQGFFDMVDRYTTKVPTLSFVIEQDNVAPIIEKANVFAQKAKQEGYAIYLTMTYKKNGNDKVDFLMKIPTISEFNIVTEVQELKAEQDEFEIDFDPVDFEKFLKLGGNVTMKFFEDEVGFLCTTSDYDNLVYFQGTVRKRK